VKNTKNQNAADVAAHRLARMLEPSMDNKGVPWSHCEWVNILKQAAKQAARIAENDEPKKLNRIPIGENS
jgi:hypothetical protein